MAAVFAAKITSIFRNDRHGGFYEITWSADRLFILAVLLTGPAQAAQKVCTISSQPKFTNAGTPTTTRLNCVKGEHYKKVSLTVR